MTSEPQGPTETWVEKHGAKYPYAYAKGNTLMRQLGLGGYPSAALIGPGGTVVWTGHPGRLEKETLKEHLAGALPVPIHRWPASAKSVKRAVLKGRLGAAVTEADRAAAKDPSLEELGDQLKTVARARVQALEKRLQDDDYLAVVDGLKSLKKSLKGLPEAKELSAISQRLSATKGYKVVAKAQSKVRKLAAEQPRRRKDCEEVIDQLERIAKKHGGDAAGRAAEAQLGRFRKLHGRLRF